MAAGVQRPAEAEMPGPFTHRIDPILFQAGGVYFWWYGLSYTLGFLEMYWFLRRNRRSLDLSPRQVYGLTLLFSVTVLAGGRAIEVAFDEWAFYRAHPALIPAMWLGGMASHGLLLGAAASVWLFAHAESKSFRAVADAVVIPGAILLGLGRIGNFIDGQIVGSLTDVWWGVTFPDAEGYRHPVVLYDGAKNLLLVPLLLYVRKHSRRPGMTAAHFIFWYAFLRIFVDLFRDYPTHRLGVPTGQTLNVLMAALGAALLVRGWLKGPLTVPLSVPRAHAHGGLWPARLALAAVLAFSLAIPGNWTQDVPARYGKRHEGLQHSWLYPAIDTSPPRRVAHRLGE